MPRLPIVGNDIGAWGGLLNQFLSVTLNNDGTLKNYGFNVKDFGAIGDNSTDDTAAIQAAYTAAAASSASIQPTGTGLTGTIYPVIIPPGIYKISDHILPGNAFSKTIGIGTPILRQSNDAKDILDFSGGFVSEVYGVSFAGGARQVRFGNNNLEAARMTIDRCEFYGNHAQPAVEFYLTGGAGNQSTTATIMNSRFMHVYQALVTCPGVSCAVRDTWVEVLKTGSSTGFGMINGAVFVNKNELIFDRMYGVPDPLGAGGSERWVDNYDRFVATHSRFGGEGQGIATVFNYVGPPQVYPYVSTGGTVIIRDSFLAPGDCTATGCIIRFVTDIPQTFILEGNIWNVHNSDPFIKSDINIATYINALTSNNRIYISIKKNTGWTPLNGQGWPTTLLTDPTKVIWELDQQPLMISPTYGATVTIDPALGRSYLITATNGSAFTINVTLAAFASVVPLGQEMTITIKNTSGGALGAITNGTLIKASAWTAPANGFSRSKILRYDGTNFVEIASTGADVPN